MSENTELSQLTNLVYNQTNITIATSALVNYLDNIMRVLSLIVYIIYFLLIPFIKSLRTRHLFFLHNVNVAGFIYTLHYVCYLTSQSPTFADPKLNEILCYLSGMLWLIVNFLRTYSVLLLAVYRYTAVYHINFFKSFTNSRLQMCLSIVFIWMFSITLSLILRYSFRTNYSVFFCFIGDSPYLSIVIAFMVTNVFLSIVLPTLLTVFLYVRILQKIRQLTKNLATSEKVTSNNKSSLSGRFFKKIMPKKISSQNGVKPTNQTSNSMSDLAASCSGTGTGPGYRKESKSRQKSLAFQFLLINGVNILGSVFSVLINISLNLATTGTGESLGSLEQFQYLRPIFRVIFILIQTSIPPLSLMNRPWRNAK